MRFKVEEERDTLPAKRGGFDAGSIAYPERATVQVSPRLIPVMVSTLSGRGS